MDTSSRTTHPAGSDRQSSPARTIAWMDGRVVPASEATVPLTDQGFLRGDAVFEAVLVRGGRTHYLEEHLARLRRSAKAVDIRVPVLRQVVTDLLAAWGERDGVLRIVVTRDGTVRALVEKLALPPSIALATLDVPWTSPLTTVKTVSYAVNMWAIRQAKARDADDALIVDGDRVLELPTGAICLVHGSRIRSPDPARAPILDSLTLRAVGEIADIELDELTIEDVRVADESFVVSASRPILPVHAVLVGDDEVVFDAPGPVTAELQGRFAAHIAESLDDHA